MREEAARRTRLAVVTAAKELFAAQGWSGTTMGGVAERAAVSQKTVEAVFRTKAALLEAAVDLAIRGDLDAVAMPERPAVAQMEAAPDAKTFLRLHARHLRGINERSASIAWVVEAASSDPAVEPLWQRMDDNRGFAVRWAAETLLSKPGRRRGMRRDAVDAAFWVALDWATYRTLTGRAGLTPDGYEGWLRAYYASIFLP